MSELIRAVYDNGSLRLLDAVQLEEGQQVHVVILSEKDRVRAVLGDLVMKTPNRVRQEIDESAILEEIARGFRGTPLPSEMIIAERRAGR